jgi:hypothetical protein
LVAYQRKKGQRRSNNDKSDSLGRDIMAFGLDLGVVVKTIMYLLRKQRRRCLGLKRRELRSRARVLGTIYMPEQGEMKTAFSLNEML